MQEFIETGVLSDRELELRLAAKVPADPAKGAVLTYRFDPRLGERVIGGIRFRAGFNPVLVEMVTLPEDLDMYPDAEREKCRHRLDLCRTGISIKAVRPPSTPR